MNQGGGEGWQEGRTREDAGTNLAWPTPGDSDVPPAEERTNHIHTYSLVVAGACLPRERGDRGDGSLVLARARARAPTRCSTTRADGDHAGRTSRIGRT